MIIFENKVFQTRNDKPNEDWTGKAKFVIEDNSELANKIVSLYPYYDFVLDKEGKLIDIIAIEKPPIPAPAEEEKQKAYDERSVKYIHEKYSYDEENKIMREYLSDMNNTTYKAAFDTYNVYVEVCKQKAYKDIYG